MAWGLWLQKGLEALGKGGMQWRAGLEGCSGLCHSWCISCCPGLGEPMASGDSAQHSDGREPELQGCTRTLHLLLHTTQVLSSPKAFGCFLQYK